jgi:thermostable 8-oxoguanine DNA glycosylase
LRFACLDTHILRFLRDRGEKAPAVTPGKHSAAYRRLEARFLQMADEAGQAPTDYDLSIWRAYSGTVA